MLTILWDWPSPDIVCIIQCSGTNCTYPSTYFSPQSGVHRNTNVSTTTLPRCVKDWETFKEVQLQSTSEGERQKWHYDRKANAVSLEPADLVLVLVLMPTGEGERWRISGGRNHMKWSAKLWKVSLPTSWKTRRPDAQESSTEINFFSLLWQRGLISLQLFRPSGSGAPPPP